MAKNIIGGKCGCPYCREGPAKPVGSLTKAKVRRTVAKAQRKGTQREQAR